VAVTIFEQTRTLLAPLRQAGVPPWVDVHDDDFAGFASGWVSGLDPAACARRGARRAAVAVSLAELA
jgi:hypothetical protein